MEKKKTRANVPRQSKGKITHDYCKQLVIILCNT